MLRSLRDARVYDCPPQTQARYLEQSNTPRVCAWRVTHQVRAIATGRVLRVDAAEPVMVHWSTDGWTTVIDTNSTHVTTGVYTAELPTESLLVGTMVQLTLFYPERAVWQGQDFSCEVV